MQVVTSGAPLEAIVEKLRQHYRSLGGTTDHPCTKVVGRNFTNMSFQAIITGVCVWSNADIGADRQVP